VDVVTYVSVLSRHRLSLDFTIVCIGLRCAFLKQMYKIISKLKRLCLSALDYLPMQTQASSLGSDYLCK